MRLKYLLPFVFCLISIQVTVAQLSTKHYIPPITTAHDTNVTGGDQIGVQYLYISTPKTQNIPFTITPIGGTPVNGFVSNATPFEYRIEDPPGTGEANNSQFHQSVNLTSMINTDKGFIIEADDVVYVSVRVRQAGSQFHAGALVSKGLSALGDTFRVGGFVTENAPLNGHQNFVSVMATEDNTVVTFTLPPGIVIANYTGPTPVVVNLDEGESYILTVGVNDAGNPNDLIGSLVTSDKPIVVNTGSSTSTFGPGGGRDYGIDQIVDASKVGSEYIFVRGEGLDAWENVLIIAHQDNTTVSVNGVLAPGTLNAGEYYVIEGNGIDTNGDGNVDFTEGYNANGNMYVQTSSPTFAYQGVGGLNNNAPPVPAEPNQGMFFVPPLSCENRGNVDNIALINRIQPGTNAADNFNGGVTIVTNTGATISVSENGVPRVIAPTEGPFNVTGNTGYVTYRLTGLTGNVSVESDQELYCAYFNYNGAAASGSFYSGFPSPPEINFNTNIATLGNCIPNVTLQSVNTNLFDSVEWFYDDGAGGGFVTTGNTTGTITPLQSGDYKLIGTLTCSGSTFESQSIPVSLCPDDLDGDLIIDNLDIDFDDDGILNTTESLGDVNIDFTDTNQPVLNFIGGATDATFITPTTTINGTTATLTGDNVSNFITNIQSTSTADIEYNLAFNSPSNVEFTLNNAIPHNIVTDEVFILTVGPNTKNITLVDPDDQLLIDTDFDDIYETGVVGFSSSEIRFRFNPAPTGTTPFRFVANSVDEITFRHELNNATATTISSAFAGTIRLTTFGVDSDGDGINDAFDADSDNDGIPDIIEAQGINVTLSGVDMNMDGLDDSFPLTGVPLVDSDGDGVLDYLDLDSDNDGVYDLFEAPHTQPDADLDGRIDNAAASVGMNGLVDALETNPDDFILTYMITDLDSSDDVDLIFSYIDLDSDGDTCPDVTEAGYTDPDNDSIIGTSPATVDTEGKVTGIPDGYTVPNSDYSIGAPIIINTPFVDVAFCEESTSTITIDSTADTFQWEVSTDGGANWSNVVDDATYSGATTTALQITNLPLSFNNNQYRVFLQRAGNSCNDTSNAITLTVEPLPMITAAVELRQCDDNNDGFIAFNLNEAASDISTNFMNETFVFYPSLPDAQLGSNAISAANAIAYTNIIVTTDRVWARAISTFGCYRISEVTLTVSATAITSPGSGLDRVFNACDDFLDEDGNDNAFNSDIDGITTFNFDITTDIINSFIPSQRPFLQVAYYRNQVDALAEINAIADPTNYRNIGYPNSQTIYVRVDNTTNNDCVGLAPLITLNVDPVPSAMAAPNLELCDDATDGDGTNGIVQTFNLDSQTATILNGQNPADYTVSYHLSATDANSGANAITTTAAYTNITPNTQRIFVRVRNNTTNCFTDHTFFDLIVNPLPIANFVADLEICDDDSDGSAQNGFSQNFDLESQTATILGTQDPAIFSVTYHASLAHAQAGTNPLGSPFSNTVPFSQIIYVRVFDSSTNCANGISNFNAIVNPEPTTANVSNLSYCDNDSDGDDANGFVQNIDLDSQILGILDFDNTGQDEDDFTVTFHESQAEATSGANPLSSPYANTTANQQTIYVRVQNDDTGCVNDDYTFDVIVHPLPDFEVTTPQIVCLNGPPLTISVENPAAVYDYVWTDPTGNMIIGSQITITSGGLYSVTATTTNGTGCTRTREIQVNESIIATITDNDVTVVDDSENNSITIDPTNLGIGDYEYALTDENNNVIRSYQDTPVFENLDGGFYIILVRDKNGCGTARLLVSVVTFPKFFTPNNDGINDTWAIKGANSTFFPTAQIYIFNRYGKVISKIDIDNPGWNGTYNGKLLPSDDYWFSINLIDRNGVQRERKGNMSLLRK